MSIKAQFKQPFAEQIDFFRQKVPIPTKRWDDLFEAGHDRGFMVAGATKAELLSDIQNSLAKSMSDGGGIDAFRRDFRAHVKKHGWTGWKGEGSEAGFNWRTQIIYDTNMRQSYNAGRWAQLNTPEMIAAMPYLKYRHSGNIRNPRRQHQAWNGLTLPRDHYFWDTHAPQNGWLCKCYLVGATESDYESAVKAGRGPSAAPAKGDVSGIDKGFAYNPGKSVTAKTLATGNQKINVLANAVARGNVQELVKSPVFDRFFAGEIAGEFPVAVLNEADQAVLQAQTNLVVLSQESLSAHRESHPEIGVEDYRKIQQILDQGEVYQQGENRLIYLLLDDVLYRAVLKRTADGQKNYFLSLFRNDKGAKPNSSLRIR